MRLRLWRRPGSACASGAGGALAAAGAGRAAAESAAAARALKQAECCSRFWIRGALSEGDVETLAGACRLVTVAKGDTILRTGEMAMFFAVLVAGALARLRRPGGVRGLSSLGGAAEGC